MARPFDRAALLAKLERVKYDAKPIAADEHFEQASLASSLLAMADLTPDREFEICRELAEHLLGYVPEPVVESEES